MGNFIENEWTIWADEHNLDIHISALPHSWTDYWGENDPFQSTIEEYRKHNQRPSWAQTFSEQGKQGMQGILRPIGQTEQGCKINSFEEELITNGGGQTKVVRFLDGEGSCRQVTIVRITDAVSCRFRQENWFSKGKWRVTKWGFLPTDRTKTAEGLLNLSVAQSY